MFARTPRLLLRPGWAEDAGALTRAIADEQVARHLPMTPSHNWPQDAGSYLASPKDAVLPSFLILARTEGSPQLVGTCGLTRWESGRVKLNCWIARRARGRGYAMEASRALIDIAATLGLVQLEASHLIDHPASGRVLAKLGFRATGLIASEHSCSHGGEVFARLMRLELGAAAPEEALAA